MLNEQVLQKQFSAKSILKKIINMVLCILIGFGLIFTLVIFIYQRKMMFFPQPYRFSTPAAFTEWNLSEVNFKTKDGQQTAFFLRQSAFQESEEAPEKLWVMFHGNGSLALDWPLTYLETMSSEKDIAFLLVDYPGYGKCEGGPSRKGIIRNSETAYKTLLETHTWKPDDSQLGVVGYSLGSAASLEFASAHYNANSVILFAPYTSLFDMAKRTVPFPVYYVATDRFDNRARLRELVQSNRTNVHIFHGEADQVIPIEMGRELAAINPAFQFASKPNIRHETVVDAFLPEFTKLLME